MRAHNIHDKQLDRYIEEACEAMLSALPAPSMCSHEFSPGFRAKNEKFLRLFRRRKVLRQCAQNAAALFLVCILGAGAFLGTNGEARADFFAWLRSGFENSIIFRYTGEAEEAPLPDCGLTWIPEGYELTDSFRDEDSLIFVYGNSTGDGFIFTCNRITEYSLMQLIPSGEGYSEKVWVNGMPGEMFVSTDGSEKNALLWYEESSNFIYMLNCRGIDIPVILHIAKNINMAN